MNASSAICPGGGNGSARPLGFNNLPMNQARVSHAWTDAATLRGSFNFTYELQYPLDVAFEDFPKDASLGVWEWSGMGFGCGNMCGICRILQ